MFLLHSGSDDVKKKSKLIFIGILAIIFLIIAINFHKIRFVLSMLSLYNQEKKIEFVDNNLENTKIVVDNPLQSILIVENNVDNIENNVVVIPQNESYIEQNKEIVDKNDNKTNTSTTKKSYINIIDEFNIKLESLRSTFEYELDSLIAQSFAEYVKGDISNISLASKYLLAGSKLEKSSDSKFNTVIKEMEKELENNGYSTSIVNNIKNYYISIKKAKKIDLINRGMKYLK